MTAPTVPIDGSDKKLVNITDATKTEITIAKGRTLKKLCAKEVLKFRMMFCVSDLLQSFFLLWQTLRHAALASFSTVRVTDHLIA